MTGPAFDRAHERLTAFGDELLAIHRTLRAELAGLQADVDTFLTAGGAGTGRPRELTAHCLAFCATLTRHHTGEDTGAFPLLAREHPELRPVIEKLAQDHVMVSGILRNLQQLLDGVSAVPDAAEARRVRGELDGLAAILTSHFAFEERRIAAALNALTSAAGTTESLLGVTADPEA